MTARERAWLRLFRTAVAMVVCLELTGCSLAFVRGPPDNHRALSSFDCTKGRGWPVTDTILASVWVLETALAASGKLEEEQPPEKRLKSGAKAAVLGTFVGLALLSGASAYYGFSRTEACRSASDDLSARQGIPAALDEAGSLLVTRDGRSLLVLPGNSTLAVGTARGEERWRLSDLDWFAGTSPARARIVRNGGPVTASVRAETLHLVRLTRHGREPLALSSADVAFFSNAPLRQESGSVRVEDLPTSVRFFYAYRDPDPLNGSFDVELVPDRWAGGVVLSQPSYPPRLASTDPLRIVFASDGVLAPGRPASGELRLHFDRGRKSVTTTALSFRPTGDPNRSELTLDFGVPFQDSRLELRGTGSVLVYLADPNPEVLGGGLVRIERTLSNPLLLPLIVEPGAPSQTVAAGTRPAPNVSVPVRPSNDTAPKPPAPADWSTEYRGRGSFTVTVRNGSSVGVFVRVRDNSLGVTAAQIAVAPNADTAINLGSGAFDVLMRAQLNGVHRYFKGNPISVPPGMTGTAVLSVGIQGGGDALNEIDAAEFAR